MAAVKFVALLCVALFAATAQSSKVYQDSPELKGLVADLVALLENLEHIIVDAIAVAVKTVLGLLDTILSTAAKIIIDLTSALDNIVRDLFSGIDDLVRQATEAGIDVTECVGDNKDGIKALEVQLIAESTTCVNNKVEEAKQKIDKTVLDIESAAVIIEDLGKGLEACVQKSILVQPVCLAALAAQIALDVVDVPLKISADVVSITAYVTSFLPSLRTCEIGVAERLTVTGTKVVADVTDCINAKMHP